MYYSIIISQHFLDFSPVLRDIRGQVCVFNDLVHDLVTDLLLKPITSLLDTIPDMPVQGFHFI